jgi:hypothetical protein
MQHGSRDDVPTPLTVVIAGPATVGGDGISEKGLGDDPETH